MRFLVFADFHYKKGMYASTMEQLDIILRRAKSEHAEFIIHLGDFCNDYAGSPEITDAYLSNKYRLPVFGIYGNHELETAGNTMETVTPLLTNQPVILGGSGAGYWHYDIGNYRLIGLDTNYSYNEVLSEWQHNLPASWGAPDGNLYSDSLSPTQIEWLDEMLCDARCKGMKALVFSHDGLSGEWGSSPDAEKVREIFRKNKGTVRMCLNGHLHTDHFCIKDGVAYFDVNTVLNGYWAISDRHHYLDSHVFIRDVFDADGNVAGNEHAALNGLSQGKNTWFFNDPLSAIVEIKDDEIIIAGSRTSWKYDIMPPETTGGIQPGIDDRHIKIC